MHAFQNGAVTRAFPVADCGLLLRCAPILWPVRARSRNCSASWNRNTRSSHDGTIFVVAALSFILPRLGTVGLPFHHALRTGGSRSIRVPNPSGGGLHL